jgi:hypothetical protein
MADSEEGPAQLRIGWDQEAPLPPPIYANYVQATFTPEDFTIQLGWYAVPALRELSPDRTVDAPVTPVARIVMPLNLMKNVIEAVTGETDV